MTEQQIFDRLGEVIRDTFPVDDLEIGHETSALDVDGWDSLQHVILMLNIERAFGLRVPISSTYRMSNVGDLVAFLHHLLNEMPRDQPQ